MKDSTVSAALQHWAPRLVANGVPLTDFQEVTSSIGAWDDWCPAWSARAAVHEEMGHEALARGFKLSAAEHLTTAAVCYHFGKFLFVHDPVRLRAAHDRAVACYRDAMPYKRPPAEAVDIPYEGTVLKGVLRADDAERAAAMGADGIVVSNHGGRALDGAIATIDALPDIVAAVKGKLEILFDSGIRRGTDVVRALAMGADGVLSGRAPLYGLARGGEEGVLRALELLREETARTMAMVGARNVGELDSGLLG